MPVGGKDAFLSKVTFRRESDWYSKTKQELKDMTDIEKRAESSVTFKKFGEGMDERDVILHNILMQGKREGYIKGAKEQKAIDIDKACEWLEHYMEQLGYIDEWCRKEDEFIKAMEE